MEKIITKSKLAYFWNKVLQLVSHKVDKEAGKGLSTNDYTNADKATVAESANKIVGFASTAGTNAAYTVAIDGATLTPGTMIALRFNVENAANATLNVNSLGAKPIYHKGAAITASKLPINAIILLIYDTAQISTGAWHAIYSHDTNTTYSNVTLGQGYGTCTTAEATTKKAVTMSGYSLAKGGITSVKFTYAVPANATMNINNKGDKAIYNKGVAITAGVIQAGDTATFIYDGTQYQLIAIDRQGGDTEGLATEEYVNNAVSSKQPTITGGATTIASDNLTTNRALVSNANGKVGVSAVTSTELGYLDGVTSAIQTQLDAKADKTELEGLATEQYVNSAVNEKQNTITGAATTITSSNLTANRALISNGSGKVAVSDITNTELNYLDGVTSNIQTQLNNKANASQLNGLATEAYVQEQLGNVSFDESLLDSKADKYAPTIESRIDLEAEQIPTIFMKSNNGVNTRQFLIEGNTNQGGGLTFGPSADDTYTNRRYLSIFDPVSAPDLENALQLASIEDGVFKGYNVFHSGVGGVFGGIAQADAESQKLLEHPQLRNITISNVDLVAGESEIPEGMIYLVYE